MKPSRILALISISAALTACDEGRIYDGFVAEGPEGMAAHVTATVTGADAWPDGYAIAVAGFADGNEYAVISKNAEIDSEGRCDLILTGIPAEASTVELCAIDRLRRRVASFASVSCAEGSDTIRISAAGLDISPATAIQTEIFNTTCAQCHGGANFAAARLNLTEGHSFHDLVGIGSVKEPARLRVEPGNSAASVLYRILSTNESSSWNYDHSVEIVAQEKLDLIKNWIDNGAKYPQ